MHTDPFTLSDDELAALLGDEPRYRMRQVRRWLARGVADPAAMTDLPTSLRARLGEVFPATPKTLRHVTADGGLTHKVLLELEDGEAIESVLLCYPRDGASPSSSEAVGHGLPSSSEAVGHGLPSSSEAVGHGRSRGRATVCISTQAGCAMGCPFCATGQAGLRRQLRTHEVVAQIAAVQRLLSDDAVRPDGVPDHVTNVVFMGMGEPLANLDVTIATLRWLIDADKFNLSARNVTVSTIGLVPAIRRLQRLGLAITLAVSLHAPNDELRDTLVPLNRQHPLDELLAACDEYAAATRRRMTFEYVMIDGVNTAPDHARQLAELLGPRRAHVNLIPMNPTPGIAWVAPPVDAQRRFANILESAGLTATIRHNRGTDIDAACGQLYANYQMASGRRLPAAPSVLPLAALAAPAGPVAPAEPAPRSAP